MRTLSKSMFTLATLLVAGCAVQGGDEATAVAAISVGVTTRPITLRTALAGQYVTAENGGGGAVDANRAVAQSCETFTLHDLNGGTLQSGDLVNLGSAKGYYVCAENGGSVEGFGSVSQAPNLPAGFTRTFTSRFIKAGGLRQHVVIGGSGPALLLVHGWPETWYAWRLLMPTLAKDFTVIAVDQRGIGLTDKPQDGYDTATLANDLVALMDALGHQRFAVVGHDTGMPIAYALAADHPERIDRLAVADAPLPGISVSPPLFGPEGLNNRAWHIGFNRLAELNELLVRGREDIYFGYEFDIQAAKKLPGYATEYYIRTLASHRDALRGSFGFYRAFDSMLVQNVQRQKAGLLTMPVLAIGGALSIGGAAGVSMKAVAHDVQTVVIPDCGHWVAEEAPEEMLAALTAFLAPYRDQGRAAHTAVSPR